jgi:hypothetical protein
MKFIKNINDENYKYIDGKNMDMIMNELFGNDRSFIEVPRIRDLDITNYFEKIKFQISSIKDLYLKIPADSAHNSRRESYNTSNTNKSNEDSTRVT